MRSILTIVLVLATLLASLGTSVVAKEDLSVTYDKFKNTTTITSARGWIFSTTPNRGCFELCTITHTDSSFAMLFEAVFASDSWTMLDTRKGDNVYVIIDEGQPKTFSIISASNKVGGPDVFEDRGFLLSRDQLTEWANASKIEMKIGPHEICLSAAELASLKEFKVAVEKELTKIGK